MPADLPKTGWRVTGQRETMGKDPAGAITDGIEVSFELAGRGQFTTFIPKARYTPANVQAAIAAYAAQLDQVHKLTG